MIVNRYDTGGNLNSVHGRLNGQAYEYLKSLSYDRFESRVRLELANGMVTRYRYDPATRRLENLKAGKGSGAGNANPNDLQDLNYSYDAVGNILSLVDSAPIPKSNEFGGQSDQNFKYDDLYRLIKADGVYKTAREAQTYKLDLAFDEIHNITHKTQEHKVFKGGGVPIASITPNTEGGRIERATSYDWAYAYGQRGHKQPHAPTTIGNRTFDYDANGNQSGWQNLDNGTRRVIVWDEDNRIREVQDPKHGAAFSYDDQGERKLKKSQYGETAYVNQFFTVRNGAIASTHVYAGTSRIVTKLGAGTPVGKVTNGGGGKGNNLQGTGHIDPASASLTEYVAPDGTTTTTATAPSSLSKGQGKAGSTLAPLGRGQGEGQANQGTFPGQGLEHRSERANEVARNTEKNKHLNGGDPGGEQGSVNSNAGGNASNAGGNGNGNAWGRTAERGNADHLNNGQGGQGQGNAGGQGNGSTAGNGGGSANGGNAGGGGTAGPGNGREFIYFYHPDHLGSTAYVTDEKANRYEHLAYFPYGETWVQESTATWRVPYQYTAKEMDSETGLYYFGARYYDSRTSVWVSADPILGEYIGSEVSKLTNSGVFKSLNLAMYTYAHNNPVRMIDPDGKSAYYINSTTGSIYRFKTKDSNDSFHIMEASGRVINVGAFNKNENGLIRLPASLQINSYSTGKEAGFKTKSGQSENSHIAGEAFAALIGALYDANVKDATVNGFSTSSGSSPDPSTSHINGKNGDIRYLRMDKTGGPLSVAGDGADPASFDATRQGELNKALNKYGWKDILGSEYQINGRTAVPDGARHYPGHGNHEHLQKFKPNIIDLQSN